MPGHTPLLGVLVAGDIVIHGEGGDQTASIDSGFISVEHDRVTIVADGVETSSRNG
jgi:F-type H+-transporting ATPase subunit epsilon